MTTAQQHFMIFACVLIMTIGGVALTSYGESNRFGDDLALLQKHTDVILLKGDDPDAQVAVVPLYQGRVMTSTAQGDDGFSFGWINRKLIAQNERQPQINVFGGEDRLWFGPEGGQFALFFKKGDSFDFENWVTPEPIDWGGWPVVAQTSTSVTFRQAIELANYSGALLKFTAQREVKLLDRNVMSHLLNTAISDQLSAVAFEGDNRVTNTGDFVWTKETGMISIWILDMLNPSPGVTIIVPFKAGPESELGPIVNDAYFGKVPADRLKVDAQRGVLYFKGDGQQRGKIGVSPKRAKSVLGSYDRVNHVLTIAQFTFPQGAEDYVNSMWELQDKPFAGDVVNSYNDGPPGPGLPPLGPFYELESSSPAAALAPGETLQHVHRVFHFVGPAEQLDAVAQAVLGVSLDEINQAF